MPGGLTRRLMLASALLVVVIAGAFAVLLLALDSMRDSGALARHSRSELVAASQLEKLVIDIETGQRGFIITRDVRFLAPWRAARRRIPATGRRLLILTDDPGQRRRVARLARAVESYLRDYSIPLVAAARRGAPAARSDQTTLRGKRLVDALRARFDEYTTTERNILTTRQGDANSEADGATVVATAGLLGSIVLIALFASYLGRSIIRPIRRAAAMAGELAGGELDVRMPATGTGEIGKLEQSFNQMAASLEESRDELRRYADEQASLRRVATFVARDVPPDELLEGVAREVTGVLDSDSTGLLRYDPDGTVVMLAAWGVNLGVQVGKRITPPPESLTQRVVSSGRPVSMDLEDGADGQALSGHRQPGLGSAVGVPIFVGGRLWGAMVTVWRREHPQPDDVEARLSEFTELVATAIANADSRAELAASRARVVAAADASRRRIERDLHDGTQQHLISLGLELRAAEALTTPDQPQLRAKLESAVEGLESALAELQELSRGIHPVLLSRGGLAPALKALARRSSVLVDLRLDVGGRLPQQVEVAAYYVISEALTNAVKHASASEVLVEAERRDGAVRLCVSDNGVGGAEPEAGSGLVGLKDRVEALGGELGITSARGAGTAVRATIPL